MRKFADFSRGWGIGEETFEFWSWLARQCVSVYFCSYLKADRSSRHRIFAELLEQGTRTTLKIPTYLPNVAPAASTSQAPPDAARNALEADAMRVLGLNPTQALQHPGFYYYTAARCTENRRARFLQALNGDVCPSCPYMVYVLTVLQSSSPSSSPGFANESKVDHLTIILEVGFDALVCAIPAEICALSYIPDHTSFSRSTVLRAARLRGVKPCG